MLLTIDRILSALNQLTDEMQPLWGKMSPQHMIEHLLLALKLSSGKIETGIYTEERLLPVQKRFLISNRPLPKLFINPIIGENLLPLEYETLDEAKQKFLDEINYYEKYFGLNPDFLQAHPVFGYLNKSEWDVFHKKHFEHHFSQFGITI